MSPRLLKQQLVGQRVRILRVQGGMSLRAFALRTGFSPSFISQVERGVVSPSIASMDKIADGLGVSLGEFFAGTPAGVGSQVVRVTDRTSIESSWSNADIEAVSCPGTPLEAVLITLRPGGQSGKHPHGPTRPEFAIVLEGRVTLTLGPESHALGKGDAVTILPRELKRWANPGRRAARVLVVSTRMGPGRSRRG